MAIRFAIKPPQHVRVAEPFDARQLQTRQEMKRAEMSVNALCPMTNQEMDTLLNKLAEANKVASS